MGIPFRNLSGLILIFMVVFSTEKPCAKAIQPGKLKALVGGQSAPFLPLKMRLPVGESGLPIRQALANIPMDSTTFFEEKNGRFEMSYDLVEKLSRKHGWTPRANQWSGWRGRFAEHLSNFTGIPIQAGEPAHAAYIPDDPWLQGSPQWALANPGTTIEKIPGRLGYDIHMLPVWDQFGGSDSMVIAVVDAGFNFHHPDLKNRWYVNALEAKGLPGVDDDKNGYVDDSTGWDFVSQDADPTDFNGHGSEVSSIIVAGFDNGIGISGMLPEAKVMPLRALDASGQGDQGDIAAAIQYAVKMGVDAINFSIGGNADSPALKAAFLAARNAGIPIVVAAGNEGVNLDRAVPVPMSYGYDNIISVAAVNHAGQFCKFSNYGLKTVDLAAPGEFVLACGVADHQEVWQDTFETDLGQWSQSLPGDFVLSTTKPIQGLQSVEWHSGANTSLTLDSSIDLRGKQGGIVWFHLQFTPANNYNDALILEGLRDGEAKWISIGAIGGGKYDQGLSFGLNGLDGYRFKLRLRMSCPNSVATRKLRFDQMYVACLNAKDRDTASYPVVSGTSIAAPHVTAYVALLKLACRRMGIPFTKDLVLAGITPDTACAGKTRSGGLLNVMKGLEFYLKTLPSLQVQDSTAQNWILGQKVEYTVMLSDDQAQGWTLSTGPLPSEGLFNAATGLLSWDGGIPVAGTLQVRLIAEGPTVLRRHLSFSVSEPIPVALGLVRRPFKNGNRRITLPEFHGNDVLGRTLKPRVNLPQ